MPGSPLTSHNSVTAPNPCIRKRAQRLLRGLPIMPLFCLGCPLEEKRNNVRKHRGGPFILSTRLASFVGRAINKSEHKELSRRPTLERRLSLAACPAVEQSNPGYIESAAHTVAPREQASPFRGGAVPLYVLYSILPPRAEQTTKGGTEESKADDMIGRKRK